MKFRVLVISVLVLFVTVAVGASERTMADTASAQWSFSDGAGTTAADSSGNSNVGSFNGDVSWSHDANNGPGSVYLYGHGYIDVPKPVIDTAKSYTVSAWVKFKALGGFQTVVSVDGNNVSGFFLQLRDDGMFSFTDIEADSTQAPTSIADGYDPVKPNVWYNIVGVHDAENNVNKLYVNGFLQGTAPITGEWTASGHLVIGRGKYSGGPVDFVNGWIRDVTITQGVDVDESAMAALRKQFPNVPDSITIDADQDGAAISPTLYGLMIEDISHSIDGGLYAELIRNRVLKDSDSTPDHWSALNGTGAASIAVDTTHPVTGTQLTNSLRLDINTAGDGVGVANTGYWGIPVKPGESYTGSLYARSDGTLSGPLTVQIVSNNTGKVFASAEISGLSSDWKRYTFKLKAKANEPSETNKFVVLAKGQGTLWLTQVSLFPPTYNNRPNGSRIDIMTELNAMHPKFLRLPGGNYLEGNHIAERFDWKKTIGPIDQRPGHQDPWGYRSTDGFGLQEYLNWCDDLHMEPVLAVYAGYSLSGEHVVAGPELQPFVKDALDEIQYLTGGKNTTWGAKRVANGHPAPYTLHYVEIGNEDFFDRSGSYEGRFAAFYDAIKAAYPNLQLIATTQVRSRKPDLVDDHYYRSAGAFEGDWKHYDNYDRSGPKIFVGEYASQEGQPTPNLRGALGDASFMAGFERNADVVKIASYAPLLVNVNNSASQWGTNLIGFDALTSYVSPGYYTQQLFSIYHGNTVVPATFTGSTPLPYCVNKIASDGTIYLKAVNARGTASKVTLTIDDASTISPTGTAIVLTSASDTDTNTIFNPNNVKPVTTKISGISKKFTYTFPPYSLTVLILHAK